uniref:Kazal-like domain-containing protein n=1 Tax=Heliothis virescens TaxID=7102 RepID=A0A2A4K2N1_HELVI
MILLHCSIVAMIIFIPLTSIQHFVEEPPLSDCLLADICNHTWIPECGKDELSEHLRLFIDECDMFEYNCDFDMKYKIVNYSDCFGPQTCPTLGKLYKKLKGFAIYHAKRRMMMPDVPGGTTPLQILTIMAPLVRTKRRTQPGKRRYTPEKTKIFKRTTTTLPPCMRGLYLTPPPYVGTIPKPRTTDRRRRFMPKQLPPQRITTRIMNRLTTQIIRTATVGTVVLSNVTVWKNGRMMVKIVKGYKKPMTTKGDSDFLE